MMRAAIFLDRDGVINHDPGDYTKSLAEFSLLPTFLTAMKSLKSKGFEVVVITNQGGIAKGLYSHEDVEEIHTFLKQSCEANGTPILDVFYAPHHPDFGASLSRKPRSLMIERALAKHNLDPARSWMIGDKTEQALLQLPPFHSRQTDGGRSARGRFAGFNLH